MAAEYFKLKKFSEIGTSPDFPRELDPDRLDEGAKLIMLDPYGFYSLMGIRAKNRRYIFTMPT